MAGKLAITVGLPLSGKSTYARILDVTEIMHMDRPLSEVYQLYGILYDENQQGN